MATSAPAALSHTAAAFEARARAINRSPFARKQQGLAAALIASNTSVESALDALEMSATGRSSRAEAEATAARTRAQREGFNHLGASASAGIYAARAKACQAQ